jgi:sporulation protein YlmC with PRC-barrel domain
MHPILVPVAAATLILSVPSGLKDFLGMPLRDVGGERVAMVQDLQVDLANAAVRYAILEAGGRRVAYPFAPLEVSIDGKRLLFHGSAERLARAPALDECGGSPDWAAYWAGAKPPQLAPASALIGAAVVAPDGRGELADVIIDAADGKVAFVVVRLLINRLHAVPLLALRRQGDELKLAFPLAKLDRAHDISAADLAHLRDRPVLAQRLAQYAQDLLR